MLNEIELKHTNNTITSDFEFAEISNKYCVNISLKFSNPIKLSKDQSEI